jgi:L-fucose mutarotase
MLKGINPLLTPELLKLLMEMGHDDSIVIADANFTAMTIAAGKPVLRLPGTGIMQVCGTHRPYLSELQRDVLHSLAPDMLPGQNPEALERFAFYDRARAAYAVILTGEKQPFGNFILRKGVIGENLRP